jgi:hypothetical protein
VVRKVDFVRVRISYVILTVRCNSVIVLNVHVPYEDKSDDKKGGFCEEVGRVCDEFPRYDIKILLGHFNAEEGREGIFKPTIGNDSSHEIGNDDGVVVVNFATSKNLIVKSAMSPSLQHS